MNQERSLDASHLPSLVFGAPAPMWWGAQHLSFLGSALLFWWALIYGWQGRMDYGAATFYVFTTAAHSGALGALLTFAPTVWYRVYSSTTAPWGLTALEDQQIGGLLMWVPAGVIYLLAGVGLFGGWLKASELRAARQTAGFSCQLALPSEDVSTSAINDPPAE